MPPANPAIEVAGLTKAYGDHTVLNGVDLTIPEGTVYALLGPNGAGKTTIVNILSTLLTPGDGEIRVAGFDVRREPAGVRGAIGVTGQFSAIDELLTGRENLQLMADLAHLDRASATTTVTAMLERFDLVDAADRRAQTYSGGMKRRLDLAMTLIVGPRLIFLDEPTAGLDPRSRRDLWAIVREQVADGVTVLLTTQYLDEADQLADRIGVLDGGRLVAEGTAAELKRRVPGGHVSVQFTDAAGLASAAASQPDATTDTEALTMQMPNDGSIAGLRRVLDRLDDEGVAGLTVESADLDDVFLALTGHAARAPASAEIPRMSTTYTIRDSATMLRRNLLHVRRYPSLSIMLVAQPILFLLLFVYVFGGTMGAGLPGPKGSGDRSDYLVFITPGILIMTVASVALGTAISTATDMTTGIIARFRTMDIARVSVLTGHVLGAVLKTGFAVVVVTAFAFLLGFRSDAGPLGWLGAIGLLILIAFSLTWLTVGLGLAADSVETASNTPLFLMILPFISSAFVPTAAMPAGLRQFAQNQPFTPMIDTLRALVTGGRTGSDLWLALGWCVLIALLGFLWSRRLFLRVPAK